MSGSRQILVVDDQPDILDLAAVVLAGAGFEVITAGSGEQALDLLAGERFDLVLLDINMPEMDGWETLRLIRADEPLRDLPVAMFSVKSEAGDKVLGLQEGALDYITKPFEVDELVGRVRQIFDSVNSADGPPAGARP
jgi:DNA-binding response OmpR family regulator